MERNTVGSLLRSTQALRSQLCGKQTLEQGIAYYSERFANLPEANQFREVVVGSSEQIVAAFDEAQAWFSERDLRCHVWAPAGGEASPELAAFLAARGYEERGYLAMTLATWVEIEPVGDVRILPARAMRAALRRTFHDAATSSDTGDADELADAMDERMNDPQFDVFVAMIDAKPMGRCGLYQVGDIARVVDLCVSGTFRRDDVERALTAHVLAMAKRLQMRNICVQVDEGDAKRRAWFGAYGFVADGRVVEFERPART